MNGSYKSYLNYKKPSWAPPGKIFAPVWTFLYVLILISFGYVFYRWVKGEIGFIVVLPFILNLIFNLIYTPIQFGLKNFKLAAIDILLVWITLIWFIVKIYPIYPWVVYINIPYLLWVSFASYLQLTVTKMNWKK